MTDWYDAFDVPESPIDALNDQVAEAVERCTRDLISKGFLPEILILIDATSDETRYRILPSPAGPPC